MTTVNTKTCSNCGAKCGAPDVFCGNCGRSFTSSAENHPTPLIEGLQQMPITPRLYSPGVKTPTSSVYTLQPSPRSARNKIYLIVVPLLALILISVGILVGIQLVKSKQQGTTSNTPSSENQSGTLPTNANTAVTNAALSPTPSPTATPIPKPGTILYQENGSDNWQGWALSSDWKVVFQGLLIIKSSG